MVDGGDAGGDGKTIGESSGGAKGDGNSGGVIGGGSRCDSGSGKAGGLEGTLEDGVRGGN